MDCTDVGERGPRLEGLAALSAPLTALRLAEVDFTRPDAVIQLGLPPRRIDILTGISGLTFARAWKDRVESTIADLRVPFLGRDSLIRNKRASGRPKDLSDLDALGRSNRKR